jgi:hypothetical protein
MDNTLKLLDSLVGELTSVREDLRILEQEKKTLNEKKSELEWKIMDHLEDAGLNKFDSAHGVFSFRYEESVKVPNTPEEREAFFRYLKEVGDYDEMITVNSRKLNSWFKAQREEHLEEGEFKVPGLGEPSVYRVPSLRKSNV